MPEFHIRTAEISDAPAITEILNREIPTGLAIWRYEERQVQEIDALIQTRRSCDHATLVAEREHSVIGWASYGPFRAGEGYGHTMEHSIHVNPDDQRTGIGRQLMRQLLDHEDAADIHVMIGAIESRNNASIALHREFGFVETGRLPEVGRKFGEWLTLVFMQRLAN